MSTVCNENACCFTLPTRPIDEPELQSRAPEPPTPSEPETPTSGPAAQVEGAVQLADFDEGSTLTVGQPGPKWDWQAAPRLAAVAQGTRQLGRWHSGPEVKQVQTMLQKAGFEIEVDGLFGPKTQAAVLEFQLLYPFTAAHENGRVGPQTLAALEKFTAESGPEDATDGPEGDPGRAERRETLNKLHGAFARFPLFSEGA